MDAVARDRSSIVRLALIALAIALFVAGGWVTVDMTVAIGVLVALTFCIPALAWYREHALLRLITAQLQEQSPRLDGAVNMRKGPRRRQFTQSAQA
jgi:hypothetical protein